MFGQREDEKCAHPVHHRIVAVAAYKAHSTPQIYCAFDSRVIVVADVDRNGWLPRTTAFRCAHHNLVDRAGTPNVALLSPKRGSGQAERSREQLSPHGESVPGRPHVCNGWKADIPRKPR
jgi:hypothetical protein